MQRTDRLFQLIQLLRTARKPVTGSTLASVMEVSLRTLYRDVATLQAMRVPIEGEAGVGYVMRRGYDLPPLMFTAAEIEALLVGIALLRRTSDPGLQSAAAGAFAKIREVLPAGDQAQKGPLYVSGWQPEVPGHLDLREIRAAVRDEACLRLAYRDAAGRLTRRTIRPIALVYFADSLVIAAWCELRRDFRHFRPDRIESCRRLKRHFLGEGPKLLAEWRASQPNLID